jgi:MYM-type Zinc finger with FCS sequence motif
MAYISRDSFARTELHRSRITNADVSYAILTCDWCGQAKALYRYQTESDGGRVSTHPGRFCSTSCFKSYHGA